MKRNKLMAILVGAIVLSSIGVFNAVAQSPSQRDLINSINKIPMTDEQITDPESDPVVETRNLQVEFKGTNLTPQQFEQIRQARRQFRADIKQVMSDDLGKILQLVFLPKAQAEKQSVEVLGNLIAGYSNAVSRILTPEQIKIWQQNLERGAQSRQK